MMRSLGPLQQIEPLLLTVFILATAVSLYYCVFQLAKPESLPRSLWKIAPMILLIIVAILAGLNALFVSGLIICALGDYFLSKEGEQNFIWGLSAFLVGHLFYTVFFASGFDPSMLSSAESRQTIAILLALVGLVLFRLWPHLKEMRVPVILYAFTIALMAYFAQSAMPGQWVLGGVVLFVISDIVLANDKFSPLTNTPARRIMPYIVWLFYFFGQALIVLGLLANS